MTISIEQLRADFEAWRQKEYNYDDLDAFEIKFAFEAYQAGRAAIEADRKKYGKNDNDTRKRMGEPVAWIQRSYLNQIRESNVALHNVVVRGSILDGDGDGDVVPIFTAPQPAKPIVSDVEAIVQLLENREWAEHVATTPLGQRLETEVTVLVGEDQQPTELVKVVANAPVPSDESTHKWKRIEEYSKEFDGKKIDIYLGDFLLYCPQLKDEENSGVVVGYYSEPYKGWYTSETLEEVFPTHFMPLPEKP